MRTALVCLAVALATVGCLPDFPADVEVAKAAGVGDVGGDNTQGDLARSPGDTGDSEDAADAPDVADTGETADASDADVDAPPPPDLMVEADAPEAEIDIAEPEPDVPEVDAAPEVEVAEPIEEVAEVAEPVEPEDDADAGSDESETEISDTEVAEPEPDVPDVPDTTPELPLPDVPTLVVDAAEVDAGPETETQPDIPPEVPVDTADAADVPDAVDAPDAATPPDACITKNCDDGNSCTDDSCNKSTGACVHVNNTGECQDGTICTQKDMCELGACVSGPMLSCTDKNPCTTDICHPGLGCKQTNNADACEDGNPCTIGDACSGGACGAGKPKDCSDGNECTVDLCQGGSCKNLPDSGATCDDGNKCSVSDTCAGSTCAGKPTNCNDNNPCTTDSCTASTGACQNTPVEALYKEGFETTDGKPKALTAEWKLGKFWSTSTESEPLVGKASLLCDSPQQQAETSAVLTFPWKLESGVALHFVWRRHISAAELVMYKVCDASGACSLSGALEQKFDFTPKVVNLVLPGSAVKIIWTLQANKDDSGAHALMQVDSVEAYLPGCAPK